MKKRTWCKQGGVLQVFIVGIIAFAILLGTVIHIPEVRFSLGVLGILLPIVMSLTRNINLTLSFLVAKPFIDFSWDIVYFFILGSPLNALRISALLLFGYWLYIFLTQFFAQKYHVVNGRILLVFSLYLVLSTIIRLFYLGSSISLFYNFTTLIRIFDGFLLFAISPIFFSNVKDVENLVLMIWLSNLAAMITNFVVWVLGNYSVDISQGVERFNSVYNDPGGPALVALVCVIYVILYSELFGKTRGFGVKVVIVLTHLLAFLTFFLTLTRIVVVSAIFIYLIWFGFYKRLYWVVVPLLIVGITYFYQYDHGVQARFKSEIEFFISDEKSFDLAQKMGGGRVYHWSEILGIYVKDYDTVEKLIGRQDYNSHNEYIKFLLSYGIIGLCLYLSLIISFLWKLIIFKPRNIFQRTFRVFGFLIVLVWILSSITGSFLIYTTVLWSLFLVLRLGLYGCEVRKVFVNPCIYYSSSTDRA